MIALSVCGPKRVIGAVVAFRQRPDHWRGSSGIPTKTKPFDAVLARASKWNLGVGIHGSDTGTNGGNILRACDSLVHWRRS